MHQRSCFSSDPKVEHAQALRWIVSYLKETKYKGLILKPGNQLFECFVDMDFMGAWDPIDTEDVATARSRTRFIIKYVVFPVIWASKLQNRGRLEHYRSGIHCLEISL